MNSAPKGVRLHIAFYGKRNVGKSSLLNALTSQQVSIVSDVAGTTTDPVEKAMELQPIGPVLFIDTAGFDDSGELGLLRIQKSIEAMNRTDVAVLVSTADAWNREDEEFLLKLKERNIPAVIVFNQCDKHPADAEFCARHNAILTSAVKGIGIRELRAALTAIVPASFLEPPAICSDLLPPGGLAVLVVPIDKEAPKGRLILPQVQTLRDLLDGDAMSLVVKERELPEALKRMGRKPDLVICDSQVFLKVSADVPVDVPMTSFSILFARYKGDLNSFVEGAQSIDNLKSGDKVLIAENCTHHPVGEDIGRVKIPRWLEQYCGVKLDIQTASGRTFPENLSDFKLVIQCGACTVNRSEVLSRVLRCKDAGVPITNYGVSIAKTLGILERVLKPFPAALETLNRSRSV